MNNKEKMELAEWAMEFSLKAGANESVVDISNSRNIEIQFRDKKLDKLQESTQNSLNLQIYANRRYSSHSTSDLRKDELKKFITEAVASTKYLTEDQFRSLPDPKLYPSKLDLVLNLKDNSYENIDPTSRVNLASEIEKEAMAVSDLIISSTAGYYDTYEESIKLHSNGLRRVNRKEHIFLQVLRLLLMTRMAVDPKIGTMQPRDFEMNCLHQVY